LVLLAALVPWWLAFPGPAQAAALDKLKAFIEGTRSGKADFIQTVTSKSGRKPQNAAGSMMFSRPGKFRWTYDKPYYQLIVGDGEKLWVYDRDLNQVSTKKLSAALGGSPAALLAGDNALEKNFDLKEGGTPTASSGSTPSRRARSPASSSCASVSSATCCGHGAHRQLRPGDDHRLREVRAQSQLPPRQFRFTPPKGADVLGE
jgi:outer membrane lipoprotein carrier protein